MYKVKDNAEAQLQFGISSVATTLVVKEGQGVKFPEVPFLVVLNKRNSDWEITKSEKVEVSAVNGDQFTISRGFEWTTPSDFSADDFVSLFVLAKHIEQLQDKVEKKAEQSEMDSVSQRTTSLEEKVQTQEEKVGKLEEGTWADHLEKKLFTSENVTKNDALIIEHAFSSTNIGKFLPIGQTEQTKELTIPRIASGKKGEMIQLCLAKVGAPTQDVIIELKKGVKKTEFGKEVWAGWEVLATGRIPYATVQWTAVHTITLNKEISLNPGELVCVSIKQDKGTINASNYYQIIIDNHPTIGQGVYWWDKKTFFNAFCNSELFLSELFSTQKEIEIKRTWTLTWFAITANHSFYKMIAPYSAIDVEATIILNKKRNPNGNGGRGSICISVFGNIASFDRSTLIEQKKLSFSLNPTIMQELEIRQYQNSNNFGDSIASAEVDISVKMKIKDIRSHSILYAREDKALWESLVATLFGFHDGKWVGPQIDTANPTASATTGTIPPGNYVSYLTVIGPDGKKYKIWAYAE